MEHRERTQRVFEALNRVLDQHGGSFDLVVVFGSYARGYPREESDLDLYVVSDALPEPRIQTTDPAAIQFPWADDLPEPDITAVRPREFAKRYYDDSEDFLDTVLEEGQYVRGVPRDITTQFDAMVEGWT